MKTPQDKFFMHFTKKIFQRFLENGSASIVGKKDYDCREVKRPWQQKLENLTFCVIAVIKQKGSVCDIHVLCALKSFACNPVFAGN